MEESKESNSSTLDLENYQMAGEQLNIFKYPSPVLRKKAQQVESFDSELKLLCKNMLYTMYQAPGIGLAAPQVGESLRMFVMDLSFTREKITHADSSTSFQYSEFKPLVFINPKILDREGEFVYEEGCLSVPGIYEDVARAKRIVVEYQNLDGETLQLEAEGLLSVCIQHESDHLDGIVFLERLSFLKRNLLQKKFLKSKKKKK